MGIVPKILTWKSQSSQVVNLPSICHSESRRIVDYLQRLVGSCRWHLAGSGYGFRGKSAEREHGLNYV